MRGGFALIIYGGFQIILAVALILLQIQRGFAAVVVPIFGVLFWVVWVGTALKNGVLCEREGNILIHLAQHGVKAVFALQECFIKVRVNQRICCDGILGS